MSPLDILKELGLIAMRGGHAVGDNVLPAKYGFPFYAEGTFVHFLTIRLCNRFGLYNLEPETSKLSWSAIAKRARDVGATTAIANHTNFSVRNGKLSTNNVVIIYPFQNYKHRKMYQQMANIIAEEMGIDKATVRIRMSTKYKNKNYYSFIYYCRKYGIKHPLIIEYSYHRDIAGKEELRKQQIEKAYERILEPNGKQEPKGLLKLTGFKKLEEAKRIFNEINFKNKKIFCRK